MGSQTETLRDPCVTCDGESIPNSRYCATHWQPLIFRRALATKVLVVANTRIEGTWSAYVGAVPGDSHGDEVQAVRERGTKLDETLARTLFPNLAKMPYSP